MRVEHDVLRVDLPFLFGSALMVLLIGFDGQIRWVEGMLCIAALGAYASYAIHSRETVKASTLSYLESEVPPERSALSARVWLLLVGSAAFLQGGAWLTVEAVTHLSSLVEVGEEILSASIVAIGTSLPEIVVTVRASRAGNPEGAIGNVIGSNIFNSFGVLGAAALCGTVVFPQSLITFALPAMIGATVLCFFVVQDRDVTPWDGWLLLILFLGFQAQLFRAF
jgi:cation:H+ antiporter